MKKTVLIFGIGSLFVFLGLTLLFPVCTLCAALFAGAGAGWLVAYWTQPREQGTAATVGAQAGALSGIGAFLGQTLGGILNALIVGPEGTVALNEALGLEMLELSQSSDAAYYAGAIGGQACCGLINIGLMAGLGALAAFVYFRYTNRSHPPQTKQQG
jgi:hypothetical protein